MEPLPEPVRLTGYDGYGELTYCCKILARDGRKFLAQTLICWLMEEIDGKKTAQDIVVKVAARYTDALAKKLRQEVVRGRMSKEEAKKHLEAILNDTYIGLAILKDLGLIV